MGLEILIRNFIADFGTKAAVWEPVEYDEAIVGVVDRCGFSAVAVYDYDKLVEVTMELGSGDYEEAVEYVEHNIAGCFVGEGTPMILYRPNKNEESA